MTTQPTVPMPSGFDYGKVIGRFILAVADAGDTDRLPDAIPAVGTITFTPVLTNVKANGPAPTTVVRTQIKCTLNSDGEVMDPQGAIGVWLMAGIYKVNYALNGVTLPGHDIQVLAEHNDDFPLDLTNSLPFSGTPVNTTEYAELSARIDAIPPNSLEIGEVLTLAAGTPAVATVYGDAPSQFLDLGIPMGSKGDKGDKGDRGDVGPQGVVSLSATNTWTGAQSFYNPQITTSGYRMALSALGSLNDRSLISSPFSGSRVWFDRLRFRIPVLIESTAAVDNTGWVSDDSVARLTESQVMELLAGRTSTPAKMISGVRRGTRITWNDTSLSYSSLRWLIAAVTYSAPTPTYRILWETSGDNGVTWTIRADSGFITGNSTWQPLYLNDPGDHPRHRFTIYTSVADATEVNLASIQVLSGRAGDQGSGFQDENPFTWNGYKAMIIQPTNNGQIPLTLKGWSNQSADYFRILDAASAIVAQVDSAGSLRLEKSSSAIYLRSPNNTRYRVAVTDAGALIVTQQ